MPKDRLAALCLLILPARVVLDLLWWSSIRGLSPGALCSVLFAGLLSILLLVRLWQGERSWGPWGALWLLIAAVSSIGTLRAASSIDVLRYGIQLVFPVVWVAALRGSREIVDWPILWTRAAALPVVLSIALLAMGQPWQHVLHGWPRLIGAYGNLHTHAATMTVLAATLGPIALWRRDRLAAVVAVGATICLAATWVRGGWAWMLLSVGIWLVVSGRVKRAVLLTAVVLCALVSVGILRERFADLVSLLSLTAPEGGWDALGSWRIRIWTDSLSNFLNGSGVDLWFGRGFGGQYGLHRHLDPHSDWLSVLYQLGVVGFLVWGVSNGILLVALFRRRRDDLAALAFSLLAGALVIAAVSNDLLFRPTPSWWTYGLVGVALARS